MTKTQKQIAMIQATLSNDVDVLRPEQAANLRKTLATLQQKDARETAADVAIATINAELEGADSNPTDETVLTTSDEIATINASLADSPKVAAENAKRVAAGKPRMTAAEAREFEMYSETNANIVENACPNGCVAYEDVFTFNRWIAQGFVVMKGQKSTKITVYTKRETVDATTGEKKFARVPRPVSVFCRCQVTKLGTKKAAA